MQTIFKRYEKKYLISREQGAALQKIFSQHMAPDHFGEYLVQNLYYDTENWDVIRASVEKPMYKEKMRLRCYGEPNHDTNFFLELKKKYKGVVYKRRIAIPSQPLSQKSIRDIVSAETSQISRELDFYLKINEVSEKIYIVYRRLAFAGIENEGLRVTFDTDIRFRMDDLNFSRPDTGHIILPQDTMLMEIKTLGGMPLWMAGVLSEHKIYPTAFSKFGVCYTDYILKSFAENPAQSGTPGTEGMVSISA